MPPSSSFQLECAPTSFWGAEEQPSYVRLPLPKNQNSILTESDRRLQPHIHSHDLILYFMFSVYTSNALIGSPTAMFELLKKAAIAHPVEGNQDGSF